MSWLSNFEPGPSSAQAGPSRESAGSSLGRARRGAPYSLRPTKPRAAPPAASLRSEDSQPNEGARRSRPWEIDAPPTIGSSRNKAPTHPRPKQQSQNHARASPNHHDYNHGAAAASVNGARSGPFTASTASSPLPARPSWHPPVPQPPSQRSLSRPTASGSNPTLSMGALVSRTPAAATGASRTASSAPPSAAGSEPGLGKKSKRKRKKTLDEAANAPTSSTPSAPPSADSGARPTKRSEAEADANSQDALTIERVFPRKKKWKSGEREAAEGLLQKYRHQPPEKSVGHTIAKLLGEMAVIRKELKAKRKKSQRDHMQAKGKKQNLKEAAKDGDEETKRASKSATPKGRARSGPPDEERERSRRYDQHLRRTEHQKSTDQGSTDSKPPQPTVVAAAPRPAAPGELKTTSAESRKVSSLSQQIQDPTSKRSISPIDEDEPNTCGGVDELPELPSRRTSGEAPASPPLHKSQHMAIPSLLTIDGAGPSFTFSHDSLPSTPASQIMTPPQSRSSPPLAADVRRKPQLDDSFDTPPLRPAKRRATAATLGALMASRLDETRLLEAQNRATAQASRQKLRAGAGLPSTRESELRSSQPLMATSDESELPSRIVSEALSSTASPVPSLETSQSDVPLALLSRTTADISRRSQEPPSSMGQVAGSMHASGGDGDDDDDEENVPLMKSMGIGLTEDSDEDLPLWQGRGQSESSAPPIDPQPMQRRSPSRASIAPSMASTKSMVSTKSMASTKSTASFATRSTSTTACSMAAPSPLVGELTATVANVSSMILVPASIKLTVDFLAPLASKTFVPNDGNNPRMRKAAFDTTVAVSQAGSLASLGYDIAPRIEADSPAGGVPVRLGPRFKSVVENAASFIERVEDVRRLTSKVCGIASSTSRVLGIGPQPQPHQVSLVTADNGGRRTRVYHLDARPHPQGALAISPFPSTAREDATSIDFATGGGDGVVNHWRWSTRSGCDVERLHTIHGNAAVTAMEHLSIRQNLLVSASHGMVVGFDISQLNLAFSWPTSERVVHLQRTPNPDLVLSTCARRDYDQFRLYDVSGRSGPVSRSVISFGWLNNVEGKRTMGRGCFHPVRKSIFAHGSEDGFVRVWDLRKARDPLVVHKAGDEPIGDVLWKGDGDQAAAGGTEDTVLVATAKGVRVVDLTIQRGTAV
ncbi:hypothetical protein ACQY0O_003353 [Thecaphora frezii]